MSIFTLNRKLIVTVVLVFLSFGLTQLVILFNLYNQSYFTDCVNQSGQQGILSQQFSKQCFGYHANQLMDQNALDTTNLQGAARALTQLKENQYALIELNKGTHKHKVVDSLLQLGKEQIQQLEQVFLQFKNHEAVDDLRATLQSLTLHEEALLVTMKATVYEYEEQAKSHLYWISFLDLGLAVIWMGSISMAFLYIILPGIKTIQNKNVELRHTNKELQASKQEINNNLVELAKIQEQLKVKEKLKTVFIEQSPHAVAMFDKEMNYIAVSEKWVNDHRLKGKKLIGKSHYEVSSEIKEEWKVVHRECLNGAFRTKEMDLFKRSDGSIQWLNWDVRPWYLGNEEVGGIIIYTVDVTEKKLLEIENKSKEEIISASQKLVRIGTWEIDLIQDKVHWGKITRLIYEAPDDFKPDLQSYSNYIADDYVEISQNALQNAMETGESFDLTLQIKTCKGNLIWVRGIGQTEIKEGVCIRIFGVFQDIDKLINYQLSLEGKEKSLLELTEQLKYQNKQLADFAQITSHNLRAPISNLNSLIAFYKKADTKEDRISLFDKFEVVTAHLTKTLNTLTEALRVSNSQDLETVKVIFHEKLEDAKKHVSDQLENGDITIEVDFSKAESIQYNPIYMESIFLNLLTNAIKYRALDRPLKIKITTAVVKNKTILYFQDNGSGIDLQRHGHKLFKLNKTFHRNKDAKGLGLFMTKTHIESLGGEISAESALNEGTTFMIKF